MKNQPYIENVITNDYHNEVGTKLHAEWQMNRFFRTVVDNTPTEDEEGYDIELFPIESIAKPNRPKAGICKAVVGQAYAEPRYHSEVPAARFYTADPTDPYKYWQSPTSAVGPGFLLTDCAPQVLYVEEDDVAGEPVPTSVFANKAYFTVENTFAEPTEWDLQVQNAAGGSWITIASDIAIPDGGEIAVWFTGSGWSATKPADFSDHATVLYGVRLVVNKMDKAAYFNLIALGLSLEVDLTEDTQSWNDQFSMGEADFITPLGQISSNNGNVSLWNGDGIWTNDNPESPYYGLLDKGVIFRAFVVYDGTEEVQEFELFSDTWDSTDDTTTVSLIDGSKFFMDTKVPPVLYRDIPVQEAVWRICDIVGFNNYVVTTLDDSQQASIDIFWTDKEKTAWEVFGDLSRATQTAIYFDGYGRLNVKTRDSAWDSTKPADYTFKRETDATSPANVVSLTEASDYEANKVTVNYQPTGFSEKRDNIVPFQVVWEPDGTLVLRASELAKNLLIGDTVVYLTTKEGKTWPWKGTMNVEGEFIEFDAKRYVHYVDGVRTVTWVEDYDQQKKLDDKGGAAYRHNHTYTGALRIKERGKWNTEEKNHKIDLSDWTKTRQRNYGSNNSPCAGIKLNTGQSTVTIEGPKNFQMNDYTYLHHGNGIDAGYKYLGTRMKIDKSGHKDKVAGIFFAADGSLGEGYYLEVMATARMNGKMRNQRNEVLFYSMKADGTKKVIGGEKVTMKDKSKNHKKNAKTKKDVGAKIAVPMGRYIDFDIWFDSSGATHKVQVFANGKLLFQANIEGAWKHSNVSRMGLYARGHSKATFEYVYGINSPGAEMIDSEYYFDRILGGYYSTQADDWTYGTRDVRRRVKKKWKKIKDQKYKQRFFDEFGPIAHEVREFDVEFTPDLPVLESKIYFSNSSQAVCTEYTGDVSGGKFILANISRQTAVINGDDEATAMGNGTINHKLFIYGRPVIQKDAQKVEKEDEWAIRRRGTIEVEYDSPWIQNEAEAERFAAWLTENWTHSDSTLEVEVFGNPLIELTDVVHVNYRHIDDDYYVINVNQTFDQGLATQLTLRKVSV